MGGTPSLFIKICLLKSLSEEWGEEFLYNGHSKSAPYKNFLVLSYWYHWLYSYTPRQIGVTLPHWTSRMRALDTIWLEIECFIVWFIPQIGWVIYISEHQLGVTIYISDILLTHWSISMSNLFNSISISYNYLHTLDTVGSMYIHKRT